MKHGERITVVHMFAGKLVGGRGGGRTSKLKIMYYIEAFNIKTDKAFKNNDFLKIKFC